MQNFGVGSWLHRRTPKSGTKPAIIAGDKSVSYAELEARANRLANALRLRGVRRGDRVAYLGENDPSFIETFFACGLLGAIFVPLNTRLAGPELKYQLDDSGARVLISAGQLESLARAAAKDTDVSRRLIVAGEEKVTENAGLEDYETVIKEPLSHIIDESINLADPAMILYTSGTTGLPKGALLSHGNMTWNCINVLIDMDLNRSDVALMISPLFHTAALNMGLLPMLLKGGTVVLETKFDPARALALIEHHKVTTLNGVPTTFQMLSEHPAWTHTDISSLEKLTCGGSAIPARVIEAYEARGISFTSCYGMTEASPGVTMLPVERSREKVGSAGLPHFFTDLRVADANGSSTGPQEAGEIQVSGPNIISQYWNRAEATRESFAEGGWFRTGDMGYQDDEGFLFVSDRLKDMIISGGENIYPAEVEAAILELEAVAAVAVIGVPDEKWGEVPRAIISLSEGAALTEEELRSHLNGRLARYKIPKSTVFVDELPRTASGKIRKIDLRRRFQSAEPSG